MKMKNFIKALPKITWHFIVGYFKALKECWTDAYLFWSLDQTFFSGDNPDEVKQRRDKFMQDYKNLIK